MKFKWARSKSQSWKISGSVFRLEPDKCFECRRFILPRFIKVKSSPYPISSSFNNSSICSWAREVKSSRNSTSLSRFFAWKSVSNSWLDISVKSESSSRFSEYSFRSRRVNHFRMLVTNPSSAFDRPDGEREKFRLGAASLP